jgi:ferredoxin-NADP reductase
MLLKLVKKINEAKDTKSFFFTPSEIFTWQAGQYLYLTLDRITKQFTIASSPTEKLIQITTRIRKESKFKQKLNNLKIGNEIEARGPSGTFVLVKNNLKNIFLTGGIGITPFRSMIKNIIDNRINTDIHLIYSNSDSDFVFKNEIDQWQKENGNLKIEYHNSSISGHLDAQKLNNLISVHFISSVFWVVGPPAFVNAMEDALDELKIPLENIRTEKFIGY